MLTLQQKETVRKILRNKITGMLVHDNFFNDCRKKDYYDTFRRSYRNARCAIEYAANFGKYSLEIINKYVHEQKEEYYNNFFKEIEENEIKAAKIASFLNSPEYETAKKKIGLICSPVYTGYDKNTEKTMKALWKMTFQCVGITAIYDQSKREANVYYVCEIKNHPAFSINGIQYKKNFLVGTKYNFLEIA